MGKQASLGYWLVIQVVLILPLLMFCGVAYQQNNNVVLAQSDPEAQDTIPPSTPGTPTSTGKTSKTINLSWSPSSDTGGAGVAGYEIYRNNILIMASSTTTFLDTGLSPGTTYVYKISAYDNDDNTSPISGELSISTHKRGDANGDGKVDAIDLNRLATNWGKANAALSEGNFDESGSIDAIDLNIIATSWGQ